jgi:hypothetical protein
MRYALLVFLLAAVLTVAGLRVLPSAWEAGQRIDTADDPAVLTRAGLRVALTPERLQAELDDALKADDVDLAASFLTLAQQEHMDVPKGLQDRYADATGPMAVTRRFLWNGAVKGEGKGAVEMSGMITSDLVGVGDLRDLSGEGVKLVRGERPNMTVIGLAAAGLAITGATWASLGGASPARAGVSTIKAVAKVGRLSRPLAAELGVMLEKAVDIEGLRAATAAVGRLDLAGARAAVGKAVDPAELKGLVSLGEGVAAVTGEAGVRGAEETLAVAQDGRDIERVAELGKTRKGATAAILHVLGRGAVVLGGAAIFLASWVVAGASYLWLVAILVVAVVEKLVRAFWRTRPRGGKTIYGGTLR